MFGRCHRESVQARNGSREPRRLTIGLRTHMLSSPLLTSFWLVLIVVVEIVFLGAGSFSLPDRVGRPRLPLEYGHRLAFAYAKGIRDIFSGHVGLPFLLAGQRRAGAWIVLAATIVLIADGFIMMKFSRFQPLKLSSVLHRQVREGLERWTRIRRSVGLTPTFPPRSFPCLRPRLPVCRARR